jgi:hypothetical protein
MRAYTSVTRLASAFLSSAVNPPHLLEIICVGCVRKTETHDLLDIRTFHVDSFESKDPSVSPPIPAKTPCCYVSCRSDVTVNRLLAMLNARESLRAGVMLLPPCEDRLQYRL